MPVSPLPIAKRFMDKVELIPFSTCWWWTASIHSSGYGQISSKDGPRLAHRLSYELHKGEIPKGMFVCHTCDERLCVNPDHLWLGNNQDNVDDMCAKDRVRHGEHHYASKFSKKLIEEVKALSVTMSQSKIGRKLGISQPYVCEIINGKKRKRG